MDAHSSFESLYRGHRAEVFRAALRAVGNVHDAEDVTQAAFVDAYRAVLAGTRPESPRAWLLAIAENVRRRRFRRARGRPPEEPLDPDATPAPDAPREQADALVTALTALSPQHREVFLLREVAGLSYDEIADRTGATVGSVQMALFRARRTLRNRLEGGAPALLPLPGWLQALASRPDSFAGAPRAAGIAGAAVLALGGAGASVATADREPATSPEARIAAALPESARPLAGAAPVQASAAARPQVAPARAPEPAPPTPPLRSARPVETAAAPVPAGTPRPAPVEVDPAAGPRLAPSPLVEPLLVGAPKPVVDPAPLLEAPLESMLAGAGATDAAGAVVQSLPAPPPASLPPIP